MIKINSRLFVCFVLVFVNLVCAIICLYLHNSYYFRGISLGYLCAGSNFVAALNNVRIMVNDWKFMDTKFISSGKR